MYFYNKYIKYKTKYLKLKEILGGNNKRKLNDETNKENNPNNANNQNKGNNKNEQNKVNNNNEVTKKPRYNEKLTYNDPNKILTYNENILSTFFYFLDCHNSLHYSSGNLNKSIDELLKTNKWIYFIDFENIDGLLNNNNNNKNNNINQSKCNYYKYRTMDKPEDKYIHFVNRIEDIIKIESNAVIIFYKNHINIENMFKIFDKNLLINYINKTLLFISIDIDDDTNKCSGGPKISSSIDDTVFWLVIISVFMAKLKNNVEITNILQQLKIITYDNQNLLKYLFSGLKDNQKIICKVICKTNKDTDNFQYICNKQSAESFKIFDDIWIKSTSDNKCNNIDKKFNIDKRLNTPSNEIKCDINFAINLNKCIYMIYKENENINNGITNFDIMNELQNFKSIKINQLDYNSVYNYWNKVSNKEYEFNISIYYYIIIKIVQLLKINTLNLKKKIKPDKSFMIQNLKTEEEKYDSQLIFYNQVYTGNYEVCLLDNTNDEYEILKKNKYSNTDTNELKKYYDLLEKYKNEINKNMNDEDIIRDRLMKLGMSYKDIHNQIMYYDIYIQNIDYKIINNENKIKDINNQIIYLKNVHQYYIYNRNNQYDYIIYNKIIDNESKIKYINNQIISLKDEYKYTINKIISLENEYNQIKLTKEELENKITDNKNFEKQIFTQIKKLKEDMFKSS